MYIFYSCSAERHGGGGALVVRGGGGGVQWSMSNRKAIHNFSGNILLLEIKSIYFSKDRLKIIRKYQIIIHVFKRKFPNGHKTNTK